MSLIGKKNISASIVSHRTANIVSDDGSIDSSDSMIVLLLCSVIRRSTNIKSCLTFVLMLESQQHTSYMIHQKLNTT